MHDVRFEWDDAKAAANVTNHGVSFDEGIRAFADPLRYSTQDRIVDGEERWQTIGTVGAATLLLVAHTWTEDNGQEVVRIISVRKTTKHERRLYERQHH